MYQICHAEDNVINVERVAPFRNVVDNMKYSKNRVQLIKAGAPPQEPRWTYLFDIAKYHGNLKNLINPRTWRYIFNSEKMYSRGFIYYEDTTSISFEDTRDVTVETPLEEEINALFIDLRDKRHEAQYVEWNRDYEKWMEETEAVRNKLKNR